MLRSTVDYFKSFWILVSLVLITNIDNHHRSIFVGAYDQSYTISPTASSSLYCPSAISIITDESRQNTFISCAQSNIFMIQLGINNITTLAK